MRRLASLILLLALPTSAAAQGSAFGVRGLGVPGRSASAKALAQGGASVLFDHESGVNPATLTDIVGVATSFNLSQGWSSPETPAGGASVRGARFPQATFATSVRRTPLWLGASMSTYTNRDFSVATIETLQLRGVSIDAFDTLTARGGLSDLRLAAALRASDRLSVGVGAHVVTGRARFDVRRAFSDSAYRPFAERSEVSYLGVGVSLGLLYRPDSALSLALTLRSDGSADVDRDSTGVGTVDLPYSVAAGARWVASRSLTLSGHASYRTWSGANSDVQAQGGVGAVNTLEIAAGAQILTDPRRPFRRPIRLGARYAQLPFQLVPGDRPRELGLAVGTGGRFAQGRGGIDLTLEHLWRNGDAGVSERAFIFTLGVSVRP